MKKKKVVPIIVAIVLVGLWIPIIIAIVSQYIATAPEIAELRSRQSIPEEMVITLKDEPYPSEYMESDAVAFRSSCTNEGPFNWGCDYWQHTDYIVHFNGELEINDEYSLSGKTTRTVTMSYSDIQKLQQLADQYLVTKTFYNKDYSGYCDGSTWSFTNCSFDGTSTYLYGGYTDGQTELESMKEIFRKYDQDISLTDRAFPLIEGEYYVSSDENRYVKIYTENDVKYIEISTYSNEANVRKYEILEIDLTEDYITVSYDAEGEERTCMCFDYTDSMYSLTDRVTEITYIKHT